MICPKCNSRFYLPPEKFIYRDGKVFIVTSCPRCLEVFKEVETKYGQGKRLVLIFFGILLGIFTLVSLMSFIPVNYFMSAILIVFIIIFAFTTYLKIKTARTNFFSETVKKETTQNDNEEKNNSVVITKHDDPLMNKIVEDAKKTIGKNKMDKNIDKKKRHFLVIIIIALIIFNEYPVILEVKNFLIEKKIYQTKSANSLRDLRGEQLAEELDMYYDLFYVYPPDLQDEVIINNQNMLKELRGEYEKDELGKEIKLSDFTYKSTKNEFELCLNEKNYSKCWRGKEGRAF